MLISSLLESEGQHLTKKKLTWWSTGELSQNNIKGTTMSGNDYITILHTISNKKLGKRYHLDKTSQQLIKKASVSSIKYSAQTLAIKDLEQLDAVIKGIDEHMALILGFIKGTEGGEPYIITSESDLREKLDVDTRPVGLFKIEGDTYAGRFKENFTYSSYLLIDRDIDPNLPTILKTGSAINYLRQLAQIIPTLPQVSKLIVPSSTDRVVKSIDLDQLEQTYMDNAIDGDMTAGIRNCHIYIQVEDPTDIVRFRKDLQIKLFANELGYGILNSVGVGMRRTILDLSVMSAERIVFESKPALTTAAAKLYTVVDPVTVLIEDVDEAHYRLDTSEVMVSYEERQKVSELYHMHYSDVDGNVDLHVAELREDLVITTKEYGDITVETYLNHYEGAKLRCQTMPFRESTSWNGILHVDHEGRPILYDNGTHTLYTIPEEPKVGQLMKDKMQAFLGETSLEDYLKKHPTSLLNVRSNGDEGQSSSKVDVEEVTALANTLQLQVEDTFHDVQEGQFVEDSGEVVGSRVVDGNHFTGKRLDKDGYLKWNNEDNLMSWDLADDLTLGVNLIDGTHQKQCPVGDMELQVIMGEAVGGLPMVRMGDRGLALSQLCNIRQVRYVMNAACIAVRHNLLTDQIQYTTPRHQQMVDDGNSHLVRLMNYNDRLILEACSYLNMTSEKKIVDAIDQIALDNAFHPWRDWLDGVRWDGIDRTDKMLDTLQLDDDAEGDLKRIYLHRFALQVIAGMYAKSPVGLRMCLTFSGKQKIGKTEWFKWFIGGRINEEYSYFKPSFSVNAHSKDSEMMEANRKFVLVELGELDSTFRRADIAHVKGFISRDIDSYRAPYAKKTETYPRRVVYCATVNDKEFLADRTGNTRFPTLGIESFDWELMNKMEVDGELAQYWAQKKVEWETGGQTHHMTGEEERMQNENEGQYMLANGAEEMLLDYFDDIMERPNDLWGAVTVSQLLTGVDGLRPLDRKDVKAFMKSHFGEPSDKSSYWAIDLDGEKHNIRKRCAFYAPLGRVNGVSHGVDKIKAGLEIEKQKKLKELQGSEKVTKLKPDLDE